MTDDKARAAFEDWFSDAGEYPKSIAKIDGHYRLAAAMGAWNAFQEGWSRRAPGAPVSAPAELAIFRRLLERSRAAMSEWQVAQSLRGEIAAALSAAPLPEAQQQATTQTTEPTPVVGP